MRRRNLIPPRRSPPDRLGHGLRRRASTSARWARRSGSPGSTRFAPNSRPTGTGRSAWPWASASPPTSRSRRSARRSSPRSRRTRRHGHRAPRGPRRTGRATRRRSRSSLRAVLGVPFEAIRVVHSDTGLVKRGAGTWGSRSLQAGGSSVLERVGEVLERARALAAHLLEADPVDVEAAPGGGFAVRGAPDHRLSLSELATASQDARALPPGMDRGCAPRASTASPVPRSRSARTSPWWRSTRRPATCAWCGTWRSTTAAGC